jgi:hypothetical protein
MELAAVLYGDRIKANKDSRSGRLAWFGLGGPSERPGSSVPSGVAKTATLATSRAKKREPQPWVQHSPMPDGPVGKYCLFSPEDTIMIPYRVHCTVVPDPPRFIRRAITPQGGHFACHLDRKTNIST